MEVGIRKPDPPRYTQTEYSFSRLEVWSLEVLLGVVVERLLMVQLVRSAFYSPTRDYPPSFETHFSELAEDR